LNAILGWASILTRAPWRRSADRAGMRAIERSARTQSHLVDELLDVSRLVSGQMRLTFLRSL
jgi:signal transduction histidine kinase